MKKMYMTALLFALSLPGCGYSPVQKPFVKTGDSYSSAAIEGSRVRILVWNIHKEVSQDKWKNEFLEIVKNTNNAPAIILLQEFRMEKSMHQFFIDDLKLGWEFSGNTYQKKHDAYSGVLTASKTKPSEAEALLSKGLEPFTNTPKAVLLTKYPLQKGTPDLLVVNVHGINFKIGLKDFKAQIRSIADRVRLHDGPVIVAGDFNTWSKTRDNLLNRIFEDVKLKKIEFKSKEKDIETTFGNPLDHIFISREKFKTVKGSQDVLPAKSSDHQPLFVELMILQ